MTESDTFIRKDRLHSYGGSMEEKRHTGREVSMELFNLLADPATSTVSRSDFVHACQECGISLDDQRLADVKIALLGGTGAKYAMLSKEPNMEYAEFHEMVSHQLDLVARILKSNLVIPSFHSFKSNLEDIFVSCKANNRGHVATYIPQLAKVNPNNWGVSICTVDGQRFHLGDSNLPFCIQSCSKPLTYAVALSDLGGEVVHQYVGQEPSGLAFNTIALDAENKPHNPMINAGAVITASLIKNGHSVGERYDYIMSMIRRLCGGGHLSFSNSVFMSEKETADRNYALGYLMKENHCFPEGSSMKDIMEFYFQLCSVEMTCESASVLAASLANGGECPITNEKVLEEDAVCNTLSLMLSCGMYDYSGQFAFKIGLPAKSGVSGTVLLVVPNVMGVCIYSPRLDKLGNSVRGIEFCEKLVNRFNFHHFSSLRNHGKVDPRKSLNSAIDISVLSDALTVIYAAKIGDLPTIRRFFVEGYSLSIADYDDRTALHLAATEGHLKVVQFLLYRACVDRDRRDRWGKTALNYAQEANHTHIVQALLSESPVQVKSHATPSDVSPVKPLK